MTDDPRQIRTRAALTHALLEMIEDTSLSSISVSGLCQRAGVHRTTFYKHASGIEEFAVDAVTRELDTIATVARDGDDPVGAYRQAMIDVLAHVAGERALYRPLIASQWGGALRAALDERMQGRVRLALAVFAEMDGVEVPENRDEIAAVISGAIVGEIVHWALSEDMRVEAAAKRFLALMPAWWPVR